MRGSSAGALQQRVLPPQALSLHKGAAVHAGQHLPRCQERSTPPSHEACADDRSGQFQQRFVDVQLPFKADAQLATQFIYFLTTQHY